MPDVALFLACFTLMTGIAFVTYAVRIRARAEVDES